MKKEKSFYWRHNCFFVSGVIIASVRRTSGDNPLKWNFHAQGEEMVHVTRTKKIAMQMAERLARRKIVEMFNATRGLTGE